MMLLTTQDIIKHSRYQIALLPTPCTHRSFKFVRATTFRGVTMDVTQDAQCVIEHRQTQCHCESSRLFQRHT